DRKSTRLNSSHANISYAVFCLKKKKTLTSYQCTCIDTKNRMPPTRSPKISGTHRSDWSPLSIIFFFTAPATTEIYTLSLHDALPILVSPCPGSRRPTIGIWHAPAHGGRFGLLRSEEHTSELQSRQYLVCRLLLE